VPWHHAGLALETQLQLLRLVVAFRGAVVDDLRLRRIRNRQQRPALNHFDEVLGFEDTDANVSIQAIFHRLLGRDSPGDSLLPGNLVALDFDETVLAESPEDISFAPEGDEEIITQLRVNQTTPLVRLQVRFDPLLEVENNRR